MEIEVSLKNVRISPRKARIVARGVVGLQAKAAKELLKFVPQKTAYFLYKLVSSGIASAESRELDQDNLYIKTVRIDQAQGLKRLMIKSKGKADQISKRRSHLLLVLTDQKSEKTKKERKSNNKGQEPNNKDQKHKG